MLRAAMKPPAASAAHAQRCCALSAASQWSAASFPNRDAALQVAAVECSICQSVCCYICLGPMVFVSWIWPVLPLVQGSQMHIWVGFHQQSAHLHAWHELQAGSGSAILYL